MNAQSGCNTEHCVPCEVCWVPRGRPAARDCYAHDAEYRTFADPSTATSVLPAMWIAVFTSMSPSALLCSTAARTELACAAVSCTLSATAAADASSECSASRSRAAAAQVSAVSSALHSCVREKVHMSASHKTVNEGQHRHCAVGQSRTSLAWRLYAPAWKWRSSRALRGGAITLRNSLHGIPQPLRGGEAAPRRRVCGVQTAVALQPHVQQQLQCGVVLACQRGVDNRSGRAIALSGVARD